MDDAERSAAPVEAEIACRLAEIHAAPPEAEATGHCLNCGARLPKKKRWCDAYCLEDWELRRRMGAG